MRRIGQLIRLAIAVGAAIAKIGTAGLSIVVWVVVTAVVALRVALRIALFIGVAALTAAAVLAGWGALMRRRLELIDDLDKQWAPVTTTVMRRARGWLVSNGQPIPTERDWKWLTPGDAPYEQQTLVEGWFSHRDAMMALLDEARFKWNAAHDTDKHAAVHAASIADLHDLNARLGQVKRRLRGDG